MRKRKGIEGTLSHKSMRPSSYLPEITTDLFQFANTDEHIPKAEAISFYDTASGPKQVEWYDAKHEMNVETARNNRREWLTQQLKLVKPN